MKIKTSALTGAALDWAVAKCEDLEVRLSSTGFLIYSDRNVPTGPSGRAFQPSTCWSQGGPIIEREYIDIGSNTPGDWAAYMFNTEDHEHDLVAGSGPTPLVAAMRCFVASELGDEVEVPDALL